MAGLTPPRPLASTDDREQFDCGRDALNYWFRRHGLRNHESGASRVSVVCDPISGAVAGYVSLSSAQIEREYLLKADQRNQPDPLPALLLGQLAVDRRFQGKGYAASLMYYALTTATRYAGEVGCFCVLTHPLDDAVRAFYRKYDFKDLPEDPRRSMMVRISDLRANGFDLDKH